MTFYQLSLVAMCAVSCSIGISHIHRFALIYRRSHDKYLYVGVTALGIALYHAAQLTLSATLSDTAIVTVHRLKILSVFIIVFFYLNTMSVIASGNQRTANSYLVPFFVPLLCMLPFNFFLSTPARQLVIATQFGEFHYAVAQTHLGYSVFSVAIVLMFAMATVTVARSKLIGARRFYTSIMLLPVLFATNDFLVVHGVYRSILISEYYFFMLLLMVSYAFLREERSNHERLENINTELDQRIRERTIELEHANAKLLALATRDVLTGLDNRQKLMTRLREEQARYQRYFRQGRDPFSVIFIDLDNFKLYNDSFGHRAGDFLLQRFADLLRHTVRASDSVARFGGDEFVVVLPETAASGAVNFAGRIYSALQSRHYFQRELSEFLGHVVEVPAESTVNCSIGIASCQLDMDVDVLLMNADRALYAAKAKGKRCFALWEDTNSFRMIPCPNAPPRERKA